MSTPPFTPRFTNHAPAALDLAAHSAQMRRWTYLTIGGAVLLAAAVIGFQIYYMKSMTKPHDEPVEKFKTPAWATQSALPHTPPISPPRDTEAPPLPAKANPQEAMLDVVSGLTRAHLSQTYLNIGLLADAAEHEIYSFPDANALLEDINNFIDDVEKQFVQLPPSYYKTEEDRKDMEQARTVTTLLRTQTKELKAYWASDDKDHALRFQKAREETAAAIKKLAH